MVYKKGMVLAVFGMRGLACGCEKEMPGFVEIFCLSWRKPRRFLKHTRFCIGSGIKYCKPSLEILLTQSHTKEFSPALICLNPIPCVKFLALHLVLKLAWLSLLHLGNMYFFVCKI